MRLVPTVKTLSFIFMLFATSMSANSQEVIPDFYNGPGVEPNRSYVNQHFYEGTTLLGQVQLVGGSGSLPMTLSTLGKHTITIIYNGDASNASSTQTVELTVLTPFEHLLPIFNWLKNEPSP
jgi:hypothetical protein